MRTSGFEVGLGRPLLLIAVMISLGSGALAQRGCAGAAAQGADWETTQ